jgi:hypothetical protein
MSSGTIVYLVSCVSKKRKHECSASDLYISDWFCKARRYVEASGRPWFILSAEYGLVPPTGSSRPMSERSTKCRSATAVLGQTKHSSS